MSIKHTDTPEKELTIREKIKKIVNLYSKKRNAMTSDQVGDVRALLSTGYQALVEDDLEPLISKLIEKEIELDRIEAESFDKCRRFFLDDGASASQAIELARKQLKAEKEYMQAKREYENLKKEVSIIKEILRVGAHILNSMSYRKA